MMLTTAIALIVFSSDARAVHALRAMNAKLFAATSLSAEVTTGSDKDAAPYKLALQKPNLYSARSDAQGMVCDGASNWLWFVDNKSYLKWSANPKGTVPYMAVGLEAFFDKGITFKAEDLENARLGGVACRKLTLRKPKVKAMHWAVYLDKENLPIGWEQLPDDRKGAKLSGRYKDLVLNDPIDQALFGWLPPDGYKPRGGG